MKHHHHQTAYVLPRAMSPPAAELSLKLGVSRGSFIASAYQYASSASIRPSASLSALNASDPPKALWPACAAIQSRANGSQLPSAVTYELYCSSMTISCLNFGSWPSLLAKSVA